MSKFKVGDRVAVYGGDEHGNLKRRIAVVEHVHQGGNLLVRFSDGKDDLENVFPQQCRRLKPRKRKEYWIEFCKCSSPVVRERKVDVEVCGVCDDTRVVYVREARSGGKVTK